VSPDSVDRPGLLDWDELPDLAGRQLGGSALWANDEFFAEKENLLKPGSATFTPHSFGHKGQAYDGWETRRRREPGQDEAIIRLGVSGQVHGVVVDTAWFKGNAPAHVTVQALTLPGYPSVADLLASGDWETIVPKSAVEPDAVNRFEISQSQRQRRRTHLKLIIHPDGGVARLRAHGLAIPDPAFVSAGQVDLAAAEHGGLIVGCSNRFYSHPQQLLLPGKAQVMGDGWETARRRDEANDWVRVRLGGEGKPRWAEIDTSCFLGNAPGAASLTGFTAAGDETTLLPRVELRPDTCHRFALPADAPAIEEARLDVYPDGGLARLRLWGEFTPRALERIRASWGQHG
jgi:allantoicase